MLIDTHCHLDFERFDVDREAVVARALEAGVSQLIVPAVNLENCTAVLQLADQYTEVYAAVGVHPNSAADWQDDWIDAIRNFAQHAKVVAIGEIGLDYYWDKAPKAVQQRALAVQLALAAELTLPVIIHNRESSADVINMLAASPLAGRGQPGVLHSFSAGWDIAATALEMGYYLGFTGPVTFKKADDLRHVAARVPLDRILVETDAPFLAPVPQRGKKNEPAFVVHTAELVSQLKGVSPSELADQTRANALRLFPRIDWE